MARNLSKLSTTSRQLCGCDFEWIIENLSSVHHDLQSEVLSPTIQCTNKWKLSIRCLSTIGQAEMIKIGFHRLEGNSESHCNVSIMNSNSICYSESTLKILPGEANSSSVYSKSWKKPSKYRPIKISENRNFDLPGDRLCIKGTISTFACCTLQEINTGLTQLQKDFTYALVKNQFADVTLKLGEESIPAHKFILSSRSAFFRKLLETIETCEATHVSIPISNINKPVFEAFLNYLYTGKLEEKNVYRVKSLYSAAYAYGVSILQDTCSSILSSSLTDETVLEILYLADQNSDISLKKAAVDYVCENFDKIGCSCEWDNLIELHPRLASEILRSISPRLTGCEYCSASGSDM